MQSSDEVLFPEEGGDLQIGDITVISSSLSEKFWSVLESLQDEVLFSNTALIHLGNRMNDFKDRAVEAALHLSPEEVENWVKDHSDELDELIQRAAKLLSSHGEQPFASNLQEWNARLEEEEIKEAKDCEQFDALTLETLSAVASIPGLLPNVLREEASLLVEETRRLNEWEQALDLLADKLRGETCSARDVLDLLGYVAECARLYCNGNLKSLLRMIDFKPDDFLNLAEICDSAEFHSSNSEVVEELLTDFYHFLWRLRTQFLHRLREMWKVEPQEIELAS